MNLQNPLVSIVITTYNRAHLVEKAIESALNQTFQNLEIIVVDDGSTDYTDEVLACYGNKIKIVKHKVNKGVCSAKNTGLDHITGEWFTILDSDDEMVPEAIETFLKVPRKVDKTINAITCNCFDTSTGTFSGKGLHKAQFLSQESIIKHTSGEFWGLTKTALLGDNRFNEALPGWEFTLWYKLDAIAKRYYIHQALRIYNTKGETSVMKDYKKTNLVKKAQVYQLLAEEKSYWEILSKYNPTKLIKQCIKGIFFLRIIEDVQHLNFYRKLLPKSKSGAFAKTFSRFIMMINPKVLSRLYRTLY